MTEASEARYRDVTANLLGALDAVIEDWVLTELWRRAPSDWDAARRDAFGAAARAVASSTHEQVMAVMEDVLTTEVERQATNPLAVLRAHLGPANHVLVEFGVIPPARDAFVAAHFPDDPYDLAPANFDDVDPTLHEVGIEWGAAKAHLVLARHRGG